MREGMTTIQLSIDARDMLAQRGKKRETYDQIIKRIIACYDEHCKGDFNA